MDVTRIRELLDRREEIDRELVSLVTNGSQKKPVKCSSCGEEGHTARTCTKKQVTPPTPPPPPPPAPQPMRPPQPGTFRPPGT